MNNPRLCPLCHTAARSKLFAEANFDASQLDKFAFASRKLPEYMHHRLMHCSGCDLVYVATSQEESSLQSAYAEAAFDSGVEGAYAAQTYLRLLQPLLKSLPDRVGAVDIGTGDGAFLRELQTVGFTAISGVEPSKAPIESASPEIRELIREGFFQAGMFPENAYSLITCFQTIEHVDDPLSLCQNAKTSLKRGGVLCLVGHNRRALSAKLLGRRSPIYDIEHLQLFSPMSLRRLFAEAGFDRIEVHQFWNRYPIAYWTKLFPFPASVKKRLLQLIQWRGLGQIPLALPAGNLVAWGVK